ncbi:MAG: PAS domain S-box protein, partial [Oxalobacteraceae bacterium]
MRADNPESELHAASSAPTLVWYADPAGAMAGDNPLWQAFTGQSSAQYLGWGWLDAVHADDVDTLRSTWAAAAHAPGLITLGYRLRRHDGVMRQVVCRSAPVFDAGTLAQWVSFIVDLTEPLLAEAKLRASEVRLRVLDEIGQAVRALTEADSIMAVTARLLGEALGATRCAYADVDADGDRFTIRSDWAIPG